MNGLRHLGFVLLNALGVYLWMSLLARTFPPFVSDPAVPWLVVWPSVLLAVVASAVMYPSVRAQSTGMLRVAIFLAYAALAAVLLGLWGAVRLQTPAMVLVVPVCAGLYGAPMLLGLLLAHKLLGRWLCPRPVVRLVVSKTT